MTSPTALLGPTLAVQGDLSGTWGDTVNDSITSLPPQPALKQLQFQAVSAYTVLRIQAQ
jgi:hypothetical protein